MPRDLFVATPLGSMKTPKEAKAKKMPTPCSSQHWRATWRTTWAPALPASSQSLFRSVLFPFSLTAAVICGVPVAARNSPCETRSLATSSTNAPGGFYAGVLARPLACESWPCWVAGQQHVLLLDASVFPCELTATRGDFKEEGTLKADSPSRASPLASTETKISAHCQLRPTHQASQSGRPIMNPPKCSVSVSASVPVSLLRSLYHSGKPQGFR